MEFIITNNQGMEEAYLAHKGVDIDIGVDNDFEIEIGINSYDPVIHAENCRFFCPGTEYGGIIKNIGPVTSQNVIKLGGSTWRGKMNQKALNPPSGADYRYLDGEANAVIGALLVELGLSDIFVASSSNSGFAFNNYKVPLQTMFLDAIVEALEKIGGRIEISYEEGEANSSGYALVSAVPIIDYSDTIEYSQDSNVNVDITDYRSGTNHLICLGQGELSQRTRVDLYAWPDGSIQKIPCYTGMDEIEEYYDYSSAEDVTVLEEYGRKRLQERMNYVQAKMSVDNAEHLEIGDIVGARERITGMKTSSPVVQKIIQVDGNGITKITPKLKGED